LLLQLGLERSVPGEPSLFEPPCGVGVERHAARVDALADRGGIVLEFYGSLAVAVGL